MAVSTTAAKALLLSRFSDLSLKHFHPQTQTLLSRPFLHTIKTKKPSSSSSVILNCLFSGIDGGGVADDFVSTRKEGYDRGFSVISKMLKRIEPLDNSIICKGVSTEARESMKRTISTMLGLLPSDQFSVTIRVSRRPLDRLLVSSIITGYTLWNAEYRVALMRNFDLSAEDSVSLSTQKCEDGEGGDACGEDVEERIPQGLGDLSPEALNYIRTLKSELAIIEKELNAKKQENLRSECNGEENNDLLVYLRSLEPNMVNELSRPSSLEVEEIINELVQNVLQRLFRDGSARSLLGDSVMGEAELYPDGAVDLSDTIGTSRDYLAKLLF
ncbi:hypothetical protein AQUCO_02500183v1 [Aquilegia coerulea]|nr:hypothetical protein AQUCO_02500183v1 [Aquilegia coerulea]